MSKNLQCPKFLLYTGERFSVEVYAVGRGVPRTVRTVPELYDTGADPWQRVNTAAGHVHPAYHHELWRHATCAVDTCP